MKLRFVSSCLLVLAIFLFVTGPAFASPKAKQAADPKIALHDAMRKLWIDHVAWTRIYIISAVAGLPDKEATTQRLLQNQDDIGNAVAQYYGPAAGSKLTALLREHILIAAQLVDAAKAGDEAKVSDANARWQANANQIAAFLSQANPRHWPRATMQSAMKTHLDQTLQEATHQIQGKYQEGVKDYEEILQHILFLADTLSDGIIAQFPQKFEGMAKARR